MTSTPPEPLPAAALAALTGLDLGGTTVKRVLRMGEKSLLVAGHRGGRPVVVKALTTTEGFWRAKLAHEIAIYRALAHTPAPVPVPGLVHTDDDRVLVIDQLPGHPLDTARYPAGPVSESQLGAVFDTLCGFATWAPPYGVLAPVFDYSDRVERYHHNGILDDRSRAVLLQLLAELGAPDRPAHGDPLPANLLLHHGRCAVLDFEFTGLFLPGFDLAMLHTLLAATPTAQDRITALVADAGITDAGITDAFLVNRAIVLTRELRIHRDLDDGPLRRDRLALLTPQWAALTGELHAREATR